MFTDSQYRSISLSIGQFILTWNDLHEKLAFVFTAILSHQDRKRIPKKKRPEYELRELERLAGIWSSSLYDRPKREMLRGLMIPLITADFVEFWTFKEDISWILDETDKIEEIRNGAVHSPLINLLNMYDMSPLHPSASIRRKLKTVFPFKAAIAPNIVMKNRRAIKLHKKEYTDKDFVKEMRWARDAAAVLRDFSLKIAWALIYEPAPWPKRPRLPNRGQKAAIRRSPPPAK